MEIVIPVGEIQWGLFKNFGIIAGCIVLLIAILIIYMVRKKKKGEPVSENQKYMAIAMIIVFTFFLAVYISTLTRDVLHAIDIKNNNYVEETIYVMNADCSRSSCSLNDENRQKYLFRNYNFEGIRYSQIYEELQNNFVGKDCKIEYFKLSKYVIRIEVIE